jgi:hypothetical protein
MATPSLSFQNFFTTTLASGITASDTTIYLNSLPTGSEGYLVIEPDSSTNKEIIYYTSKGANFVTLPSVAAGRGVGGTTAVSHSSGVTVQMNVVAEHFEALQDGTGIADDAITTSKIAADNVTDTELDYPRWWQEIGRTTLSSAGDTITVSSFPSRKYLQIHIFCIATGGTISTAITCNSDTGSNYSRRSSVNGAADTVDVSQAGGGGGTNISGVAAAENIQIVSNVINVATSEKIFISSASGSNTAGAANAPTRRETILKWANTSAAITSLTITNTGTGDFEIGSQVVILGHD